MTSAVRDAPWTVAVLATVAAFTAALLTSAPNAWANDPANEAQLETPSTEASSTTATVIIDPEAERLRRQAERLERLEAEAQAAPNNAEPPSLWPTFIRTAVMLSAVCLLAYLILGKLMPKILQIEPPTASRRLLKVIDRLAIDQKRSVMILQLGDEYFMVGAAEQNITLMSKLDAEHIERLVAEADIANPGLGRLGDLFVRRQAKGS